MKHKSIRGVAAALLVAILVAACQPIAANPTPDPATLGFEAVSPPPAAETLPHSDAGTTLHFTSGEDCEPVEEGVTTDTGETIRYDCDFIDEQSIALIGDIETIQGQVFQMQRAALAVRAPGAAVRSTTSLPFTISSVSLADGTTCLNLGEGTNLIVVNEGRVSFVCNEDGGSTSVEGDADVLINGLYPEAGGGFTVDRGILAQKEGTPQVDNKQRVAVASLVAQPLVVTVTAEQAGKTIYLTPAQTLEVILEGNPTTGYSWNLDPDSTAPLYEAGEPEFHSESDLVGAGGEVILRFDVAGAGSGELLLDYARTWESDVEPLDTFSLNAIVALTPEQNNSAVALPLGQTLAVALPGNPSTGYSWQVVDNDGSILAQSSDPVSLAPRSVPGAGGVQLFTFEAVSPGEMTLDMVYTRPWEADAESANTFTLDVTVE